MNTVQMNTVQSPTQPDFASASLLGKPSVGAPAAPPANLKSDQFPAESSWLGNLATLASTRHLIVLFIGVAAALAWQTYGDAARRTSASPVFSLDQQQFNAISVDLDAMRQSIDGLVTGIANNEERIMQSVDLLTAGHEQMRREIAKFQALDQFVLFKGPDSLPPRPAPAPVRRPALRPLQARTVPAPVRNP
jgi:hypothetical protein